MKNSMKIGIFYISLLVQKLFNQKKSIMEILLFILIGAAAGWLAGLIMKGGGFGLLGNIIVGIVGGFLGGWLTRILGFSNGGGLGWQILVSVLGACLLLFIISLFKKK